VSEEDMMCKDVVAADIAVAKSHGDFEITAHIRIPFTNPEDQRQHYCNAFCKAYADDFSEAAIRAEYRRCRTCQKRMNETRKRQLTKVGALKKKLYHAFIYHKRPDMSKALTDAHVIKILQARGVNHENHLDLVKTIRPNFDPISSRWTFTTVFKSGAMGSDQANIY
jgi:hypothetical protein